MHPDFIPTPAAARSISPQSQTAYSRNPEARADSVVPVYSTQEVPRHSVPLGAAPLRQHSGSHNTRPVCFFLNSYHIPYPGSRSSRTLAIIPIFSIIEIIPLLCRYPLPQTIQ